MNSLLSSITPFSISCLFCVAADTSVPSIIPAPVSCTRQPGSFVLTAETAIAAPESLRSKAVQLQALLAPATGFPLSIIPPCTNDCIRLVRDPKLASSSSESHRLSVTPECIEIAAADTPGIFYGIQTLRQLLPPQIFCAEPVTNISWEVPCVTIEDYPRFEWRGLHLDVSRHFFDADCIKKYIDLMALHKFNVFHWHLCDDQGWRMEIKKYPKLTEIGAWRTPDAEKGWRYNQFEYPGSGAATNLYGGFYSQEQIKDIVAYAAERHVNILPEIEMPGHSLVALLAYPEYACSNTTPAHPSNVYCAGNDAVFTFLQDVLEEVMVLFPFTYIHVGGDEVDKRYWEQCPLCKTRMLNAGLKNPNELQSYFMKRMEHFLTSKKRNLIGWDEILEGGLPPNATVMSWRGISGGINAARSSHDVVMAPYTPLYFDALQADARFEPPTIGYTPNPLSRVYAFEPIPTELSEAEARHVLGAQGQSWTEWMNDFNRVEYMVYPRACALAEVVWTPADQKNYRDFFSRMKRHTQRLDTLDVNYRHLDPVVDIWSPDMLSNSATTLVYDTSGLITNAGCFELEFHFTHGSDGLAIASAEVLTDDTILDKDVHPGVAGPVSIMPCYYFKITELPANTRVFLRVSVDGTKDINSNGDIILRPISEKDYLSATTPPVPRPLADGWKSGDTSLRFKPLLFDVSDVVVKPGVYEAVFQYTGGAHRLDISHVELFADDKPVAHDTHAGVTGAVTKQNVYSLTVPNVHPGTAYILKAVVRSDGGNDSNGTVSFKLKMPEKK